MNDQKYVLLVTELRSLIQTHELLKGVIESAEADLRWRLAELFQTVKQEDEEKYINLSGMQGFLTTTEEKLELERSKKNWVPEEPQGNNTIPASQHDFCKKEPRKRWVKSLYRRAVKRCHPDTIRAGDEEYKKELIKVYKDVTEAYNKDMLDLLMVETYKVFVKPKAITPEHEQILEDSSKDYKNKINEFYQERGYTWSTLTEEGKELFLINFMKQQGIRFVDKSKIKEVLNRKPKTRKVGERPKNKLKERVKGKK